MAVVGQIRRDVFQTRAMVTEADWATTLSGLIERPTAARPDRLLAAYGGWSCGAVQTPDGLSEKTTLLRSARTDRIDPAAIGSDFVAEPVEWRCCKQLAWYCQPAMSAFVASALLFEDCIRTGRPPSDRASACWDPVRQAASCLPGREVDPLAPEGNPGTPGLAVADPAEMSGRAVAGTRHWDSPVLR